MTACYVVWYIVDGKTPGAIVFMWLWIVITFYPILKAPKFIIVAVLSMVTTVLIVGYELQVRVIGVEAATSNGQPAYPLYILAPYRLATVTCGILVAVSIFTRLEQATDMLTMVPHTVHLDNLSLPDL